jgi:hypothetical protein
MSSQPDLPQMILALSAAGRLASRLHGGQKQRDQHADDGNYHQQLYQRECLSITVHGNSEEVSR